MDKTIERRRMIEKLQHGLDLVHLIKESGGGADTRLVRPDTDFTYFQRALDVADLEVAEALVDALVEEVLVVGEDYGIFDIDWTNAVRKEGCNEQ